MNLKNKINDLIQNIPVSSYGRVLTKKSNKILLDFLIEYSHFLSGDIKATERLYVYIHKLDSRPLCKTCLKNEVKFISFGQGYKQFCSKKCINQNQNIKEKIANTNLEKYGNKCSLHGSEIHKKVINKFKEKYNTDHPLRNNKIKEKIKKTNLLKYGTEYGFQNEEVKGKIKDTNLEKYGHTHYFKTDEYKESLRKNLFKKTYDYMVRFSEYVTPLFGVEDYHGEGKNHLYKWFCKKCQNEFEGIYFGGMTPRCEDCFPKKFSIFEKEVNDWLVEYVDNISINNRDIITPLELDLYLEDYNLAIECNGNHWHSELHGKGREYHLNKTNLCIDKDIRLIHIFEDEWVYKQHIVKSRILNILKKTKNKIYARKCTIKEILSKDKNNFLDDNHLQGGDKAMIKLGLFHDSELISVMTFCKLRQALGGKDKDGYWELSRFANKCNLSVIGGASKLLKYFLNNYHILNIISYADLRWSDGGLYRVLGFNHIRNSKPNYWYFTRLKRFHRYTFRKSTLQYKLETFNSKLTEWDNMKNNGYNRIWDCGTMVFEYKRSD